MVWKVVAELPAFILAFGRQGRVKHVMIFDLEVVVALFTLGILLVEALESA